MKQYGNEQGRMEYEKFFEYMIVVYGDTDTKEQISNAFSLINKGEPVAKVIMKLSLFI